VQQQLGKTDVTKSLTTPTTAQEQQLMTQQHQQQVVMKMKQFCNEETNKTRSH